jgi:hypothetical protein
MEDNINKMEGTFFCVAFDLAQANPLKISVKTTGINPSVPMGRTINNTLKAQNK